MHRLLVPIALVVVASIGLAAPAPGDVDALRDAVSARRDVLGAPSDKATKKIAKGLDKALKALNSKKVARSLADEISAAAKATKQLEAKAPDEAALLGLASDAADAYGVELRENLGTLGTIVNSRILKGMKAKGAAKAVKRAQKALGRVAGAATTSSALAQLGKASSAMKILDALDLEGGAEYSWIMDSLALAPPGTGLDLDGDGEPDNGLGGAQSTLAFFGVDLGIDEPLAASIADGSLAFVIQMWGVNDFASDPIAFAGTLSPLDGDADPSDNFSGVEVLTVQPGTVDSAGHALVRSAVALRDGVYEIAIDRALAIPLGETPVEIDGVVRVRATADALGSDGLLGLVIPGDTVRGFVEASQGAGNPLVNIALGVLLDLDTDGDGTKDAMSIAFEFTSVPVVLESAPIE